MAALAAAHADAAPSSAPVLSRPALLSHIFKFAARTLQDVTLLHVSSAWEDTAINYSPFMWSRIARAGQVAAADAPPLKETLSLEQWSASCFNHVLCRVWARDAFCPSLLSRLVAPLTDEGMRHLGSLTALRELNVAHNVRLTDAGVAHLAALKSLEKLQAESCDRITDVAMSHIASSFKHLRELDVSYCDKVTDAGLAHLADGQLRFLAGLEIVYCHQIGDEGMMHVARLPALRALNASGCDRIADVGLAALSVLQLAELRMSQCDKITDDGVAHLARIKTLQHLDLSWCDLITDAGIEHVSSGLPALRWLDLSACKLLTDTAIASYLCELSHLENLYVAGCNLLTDASLEPMSGKLGALMQLGIRGCVLMTAHGRARFKSKHPRCDLLT